jgi:hypothetical protein
MLLDQSTLQDQLAAAAPRIDAPLSRILYRPISQRLSKWMSPYLTGNMLTVVGCVVAMAAAGLFLVGKLILGALCIQLFSVLSCADGDTARMRGEVSRLGDYFDTLVDRFGELIVIIALAFYLSSMGIHHSIAAALVYLAGTFLLTNSAEKYRSCFHVPYPKEKFDRLFAWLCSGSDARLFFISFSAAVLSQTQSRDKLPLVIGAIGILAVVNFGYRCSVVYRSAPFASRSRKG